VAEPNCFRWGRLGAVLCTSAIDSASDGSKIVCWMSWLVDKLGDNVV
jgi:hypothetical protein